MGGEDAGYHVDRSQPVADQRSPVHRAALRRKDVQHGLAYEKAAAEDRDRGRADEDAEQQHSAEYEDLDELQQRVDRQLLGQGLREVGDDVLGSLDADRHANRARSDAQLGPLGASEPAMRGDLGI